MNQEPDPRCSSLDDVREELGREFERAAARQPGRQRRWSRKIVIVGAIALLVVPAAAFASVKTLDGLDGDQATIRFDGKTVTVNGEPIDCPADEALKAELELDPCTVFSPAPAPASEHPGSVDKDVPPGVSTFKEQR